MSRLEDMIRTARWNFEHGHRDNCDVLYRMILRDTTPPDTGMKRVAHGEACAYFARKASSEGLAGTALDWYRRAINSDLMCVDYRVEMVLKCLLPMSMDKASRMEMKRATQIEPENPMCWGVLGGVEHKIGNAAASIEAYDRQLELTPDAVKAHLDRSTIAFDTADYVTARAMARWVLEHDTATEKDRADATNVLAMCAYREGKHEEAIELYERAIEGGCYDPSLARWNLSLAQHSIGRYKEGWANHEHRGLQTTDAGMAALMNRFSLPRWNNEPPGSHPKPREGLTPLVTTGPTILHVHQEMGYGDAIAMLRYIPLLLARGYQVRMEVSDNLVKMFKDSLPEVPCMGRAPDYPGSLGIKPFDYHIPMLSFPYLFGTEIDTVPWNGPYIKADPQKVSYYGALLRDYPRPLIGLCWSSGILTDALWLNQYGRRKSMHFRQLSGLIGSLPRKDIVSLQVGPERLQNTGNILDLLPEKPEWDDTAALVANLDLVISVDTALAHLVGAMGKPLWVMMHTEGSWHWMADRPGTPWRERSPWYPSAKLYRQEKVHEWDKVVERIARDLRTFGA